MEQKKVAETQRTNRSYISAFVVSEASDGQEPSYYKLRTEG